MQSNKDVKIESRVEERLVKIQLPIPGRVQGKLNSVLARAGYHMPPELFVEDKVHPRTKKVLEVHGCLEHIDISRPKKDLTGVEVLRKLRLRDGTTMYNYLVAQEVARTVDRPLDQVVSYMNGQYEIGMPQGFRSVCMIAGNRIDDFLGRMYRNNTYQSEIQELEKRTGVANSLVNKCTVFLKKHGIEDEELLIDLVPRFVIARAIMGRIKTSNNMPAFMSGAIDELLLEGCLGAEINLLFIKCPRVVQYFDKTGRKRLDILTTVNQEVRESVDGIRTYPGNEYLIRYLHDFQAQFERIGIRMTPVILVDDMTKIDEYSAEDNDAIPRRALIYGTNLARYAEQNGYSITVRMFSDAVEGTRYHEFYKLAYADVVRQESFCRIVSERFREEEIDAAMEYFANFTHLDATRYVAKVIADLRALSALHDKYPYGLFITRDAPTKRATMLTPVFERNKVGCTVLFADPERDQLISEYV